MAFFMRMVRVANWAGFESDTGYSLVKLLGAHHE